MLLKNINEINEKIKEYKDKSKQIEIIKKIKEDTIQGRIFNLECYSFKQSYSYDDSLRHIVLSITTYENRILFLDSLCAIIKSELKKLEKEMEKL